MSFNYYKGVHEKRRGENPEKIATRRPDVFTNNQYEALQEIFSEFIFNEGKEPTTLVKSLQQSKRIKDHEDQVYIDKLLAIAERDLIIENKDLFMEDETRVTEGAFYTPKIWSHESMKLFEKNTPNAKDYAVWDPAAGTGNLLSSFEESYKEVFASTLNEDDVDIIQHTYDNIKAFQLDFLSTGDILSLLTARLQEIIKNDEPLLIVMNPPYAKLGANKTGLYKDIAKSTYRGLVRDLLQQFIYQVSFNLIQKYNLRNTKMMLIGPTRIFLRQTWLEPIDLLFSTFEFNEGFMFAASEFQGIFDGIPDCIFTMLFTPRPQQALLMNKPRFDLMIKERHTDKETNEEYIKDIKNKHFILWGDTGRTTVRDYFNDIPFRKVKVPTISAYGELKYDAKGNVKYHRGAEEAVGYYLTTFFLGMLAMYNGISNMPLLEVGYPIMKENFDEAASALIFSGYMHNSLDFYEYINIWHLPSNRHTPEYQRWVENAVLTALSFPKFFTYSIRNMDVEGSNYNKLNAMFPIRASEAKEYITDPVKLKDLETYGSENDWFVDKLEDYVTRVEPTMKVIYETVREVHIRLLQLPYDPEVPATGLWDIGLSQARHLGLLTDEEDQKIIELRKEAGEFFRDNYKELYHI